MQQTGWTFLEKVLLMKLLAAAGELVKMRSQVDIICVKRFMYCTRPSPFGRDWVECNVYKERASIIRIAQSNFGAPFLLVE
jgi:hypothetical protein